MDYDTLIGVRDVILISLPVIESQIAEEDHGLNWVFPKDTHGGKVEEIYDVWG